MGNNDESLLARYKEGDVSAFRELVERYSAAIYNLALRLLRDPMEAENVTQEAFLRVIISLDRMRLDLPFKPYLFRIAMNLCFDYLRMKRPVLFSESETVNDIVEDVPEMIDRIEKDELRSQMHTMIGTLPDHYRAVVVLRYNEDFSYEEIAQALNLPLNTVRTHLRRAKEQLKLKLEREWHLAAGPKKRFVLGTAEGG
jgi:RNA polymerase sigma-70 factor (ECF subfamily)